MAASDSASTPIAVDDSHAYNSSTRSWMTNGTSNVSSESVSVSSTFIKQSPATSPGSSSLAQPAQQQPAASQSLETHPNLPDLMPIMFPSGDPFMYPAQPMSTLEDDHFKSDRSAATGQYSFQPGSLQRTPSTSHMPTLNSSTPVYDGFTNIPVFPSGPPGGVAAALPAHLQHFNHQHSRSQSQVHSPPSHASTPGAGDLVQSPDLVSIPNQNFVWQGFNFLPQASSGDQQSQTPISGAGGSQNTGLVDNFNPLGGVDIGMTFDELFGNLGTGTGTGGVNGTAASDDWSQWHNSGI